MPPGDKTENAVTVRDLTKRFGTFTAVDGISFSVGQGEVFGFLGPNGAGKSTIIRILCGLIRPTSGSATVLGHDVVRHARRLRAEIGYMSQRFSLYDDLTVEENISFFAGIYGLSGQRLGQRRQWALTASGLADRTENRTGSLSAGHKQRLALACSLIHEPRLLFLDEPTSGVDPVTRRNFWDVIGDLSGSGVTVIVTTHYMDEAEHCNRLALIYKGKLASLDTPSDLRETRFTGEILRIEAARLMDALTLLEKATHCRECSLFGSAIHAYVDSAEEAAPLLGRILREGGIEVLSIKPATPSLEDVFISLIEEEDGKEAKAV